MSSQATESVFRFRAAARDGRMESGQVGAPSRDAAAALLLARGLHPVSLVMDARRVGRARSIPVADLALAMPVLADLLDAGLPLTRALQTLEGMVSPAIVALTPRLLASVREGSSLSQALESSGAGVPPSVLGVIRAGERGGMLAAAIREAGALCADATAARAALRAALAYPTLLATVGTASLGLLVGVVLPRFATILGDLGQSLPASTRLVLRAGDLARTGALPVVVALVLVGFTGGRGFRPLRGDGTGMRRGWARP